MDGNATECAALLEWYQAMGVTDVIGTQPRNYFEEAEPPALPKITPQTPRPAPPAAPLTSPSTAIAEAETLATKANSLEALYNAIRGFDGCPLKKTAINTVIFEGIAHSDVMVIGEAPGADEDRQGIPFCGISGQLLDKILASIGLSRKENAYITNTVFWRPPGNRKPTPEEIAICKPFVEKHIELFNPKLMILVGGVSAQSVLDAKVGITRLRGKMQHYHSEALDKDIPCMSVFHPAYLLRQPAQKALTWQDMLEAQTLLQEAK